MDSDNGGGKIRRIRELTCNASRSCQACMKSKRKSSSKSSPVHQLTQFTTAAADWFQRVYRSNPLDRFNSQQGRVNVIHYVIVYRSNPLVRLDLEIPFMKFTGITHWSVLAPVLCFCREKASQKMNHQI